MWRRRKERPARVCHLHECGPLGVRKKNSAGNFRRGDPQLLSTAVLSQTVEASFAEAPARRPGGC